MFINKQSLKRAFGLFGAFLYVVGFGVYHAKEFGNYQKILSEQKVNALGAIVDTGQVTNYYWSLPFTITSNTNDYNDFSYGYGVCTWEGTVQFDSNYIFKSVTLKTVSFYENTVQDIFNGDEEGTSSTINVTIDALSNYTNVDIRTCHFEFEQESDDGAIQNITIRPYVRVFNSDNIRITPALNASYIYNNGNSYNLDFQCICSNITFNYPSTLLGYSDGFNDGVTYVTTHPNEYNLYTYADYLAYGQTQYNQGLSDGSNVLSMSALVNEIFKAPISMFSQIFTNNQAFQWRLPTGEVLDIGGLLTFLLTIGIALAIVRLIMKIGGK